MTRSFEGSHAAATGFEGPGFGAVTCFGFAAFGLATRFGAAASLGFVTRFGAAARLFDALAGSRDHGHKPAYPLSIDSSDNAIVTARMAQPRDPARWPYAACVRRGDGKPYSAAALRPGRPTSPAASPKRSIMTAVNSFALLVTQAPERTA